MLCKSAIANQGGKVHAPSRRAAGGVYANAAGGGRRGKRASLRGRGRRTFLHAGLCAGGRGRTSPHPRDPPDPQREITLLYLKGAVKELSFFHCPTHTYEPGRKALILPRFPPHAKCTRFPARDPSTSSCSKGGGCASPWIPDTFAGDNPAPAQTAAPDTGNCRTQCPAHRRPLCGAPNRWSTRQCQCLPPPGSPFPPMRRAPGLSIPSPLPAALFARERLQKRPK